jgi:hypothetical protein
MSSPAPETTSEGAPLLESSEPYDEPPLSPRPCLQKPILILTWLSLILPVLIIPFLIALNVLWAHQPKDYYGSWRGENDVIIMFSVVRSPPPPPILSPSHPH